MASMNEIETPKTKASLLNWLSPIFCGVVNLWVVSPFRLVDPHPPVIPEKYYFLAVVGRFDFKLLYLLVRKDWMYALALIIVPAIVTWLACQRDETKNLWGWIYAISSVFWQALLFAILAVFYAMNT